MFGNVSERRGSKYFVVFIRHCRKVKDEKVITLQMAQQLKTKILLLYQDNYFAVSIKLFFFRDRLIVLMIKVKYNLLQILTMNLLNVNYQGKSSNQLSFYLSADTHL